AEARTLDCGFAQIGAEHLHAYSRGGRAERFENTNGQRIDFFACCASGHPNSQLTAALAFLFDQRRNETFLHRSERALITEEMCNIDEKVIEKLLNFLFVAAQKTGVLPQPFDAMQSHPPMYAAMQRGLLVRTEIHAGMFFESEENPAQVVEIGVFNHRL